MKDGTSNPRLFTVKSVAVTLFLFAWFVMFFGGIVTAGFAGKCMRGDLNAERTDKACNNARRWRSKSARRNGQFWVGMGVASFNQGNIEQARAEFQSAYYKPMLGVRTTNVVLNSGYVTDFLTLETLKRIQHKHVPESAHDFFWEVIAELNPDLVTGLQDGILAGDLQLAVNRLEDAPRSPPFKVAKDREPIDRMKIPFKEKAR